jgi:hypothetical protein
MFLDVVKLMCLLCFKHAANFFLLSLSSRIHPHFPLNMVGLNCLLLCPSSFPSLAYGAGVEPSSAVSRCLGNDVNLYAGNISDVFAISRTTHFGTIQFDSLSEVRKAAPFPPGFRIGMRYKSLLLYYASGGTTKTGAFIDIATHSGTNMALFPVPRMPLAERLEALLLSQFIVDSLEAALIAEISVATGVTTDEFTYVPTQCGVGS